MPDIDVLVGRAGQLLRPAADARLPRPLRDVEECLGGVLDGAFSEGIVDELGEPIEDVFVRVSSSPPMRTDADGRIRYDDGGGSFAFARFSDERVLRKALRARWEQIREGDWSTATEEHTYIDAADPLPMVRSFLGAYPKPDAENLHLHERRFGGV